MSRRETYPLRHLLAPLREAGLLVAATGDLDAPVSALTHDSRAVEPGTAFVAIAGEHADGHRFLDTAVEAGASALVVESPPETAPPAVAVVTVTDARAALAEMAALYFGHPSQELKLVGVTGTNGKTTTATLLHTLLTGLGEKTGLVGTVEVRLGDEVRPATHTTPDALAFNGLLRDMAEAGCTACAAEVSSHALEQHRVRGLRFAAAVFTNLTHDHLDYHGTPEAYQAAKAKLFAGLDADAVAIVNRDDRAWRAMVHGSAARVVTYGEGAGADVTFEVVDNALDGLCLRIDGVKRKFRLAGAFNAYNLAAAYTVGRALGHEREPVLDVLAGAAAPPGRLETLTAGDGTIAVVDYAHTPDALDNVLSTVRDMLPAGATLWCVFGCGGDRDRAKRPEMGRVAERLADGVILTSDNPRTEDPEAILAEIRGGMRSPETVTVIADRAEAIRHALGRAAAGDVVVIAGKGHEDYQIVGTERRPFDDRDPVRQSFRERSQPTR